MVLVISGLGFVDFGSCTDFGVRDWYKTGFDENLIFVGFLMVEFQFWGLCLICFLLVLG